MITVDFNFFIKQKIIKMIFEGVLLEKVQESIDRRLAETGGVFGWGIMKDELAVANELNKDGMIEDKRQIDDNKLDNERKREDIKEEWRRIFKEIWLPTNANNENVKEKKNL